MKENKKNAVLLLTLVHPDFLPPVYAIAQVLRDEGYKVHILTFDSYVKVDTDLGSNIVIESAGRHHNIGLLQRLRIRRKYTARAKELVNEQPLAIISFCAFTYLCALSIRRQIPHIYHALEVADFLWSSLKRSPLSQLNNLLTIKKIHKAHLVATPSDQRSAWLAGRSGLGFMPQTILNAAYIAPNSPPDSKALFSTLVPTAIQQKKIILYTGAINNHLCIKELVQSFCTLNDAGSALLLTGFKDNDYCNEIKAIVNSSVCADRIVIFPYVTRSEMLALQANADIGVCLAREYNDNVESRMMAPNKVGEYLAKGLYLLSIDTEYMRTFGMRGIASLAVSPTVPHIVSAMKEALLAVSDKSYSDRIYFFVANFYSMKQQARPILDFLKKLK